MEVLSSIGDRRRRGSARNPGRPPGSRPQPRADSWRHGAARWPAPRRRGPMSRVRRIQVARDNSATSHSTHAISHLMPPPRAPPGMDRQRPGQQASRLAASAPVAAGTSSAPRRPRQSVVASSLPRWPAALLIASRSAINARSWHPICRNRLPRSERAIGIQEHRRDRSGTSGGLRRSAHMPKGLHAATSRRHRTPRQAGHFLQQRRGLINRPWNFANPRPSITGSCATPQRWDQTVRARSSLPPAGQSSRGETAESGQPDPPGEHQQVGCQTIRPNPCGSALPGNCAG